MAAPTNTRPRAAVATKHRKRFIVIPLSTMSARLSADSKLSSCWSASTDQRIRPLAVSSSGFGVAMPAEGCILLRRLVNPASDIGHERGAFFRFGHAAHENHQNKRTGGVDDGCVVVELGELAGFMGDASARRKSCRNGFIEFLAREG